MNNRFKKVVEHFRILWPFYLYVAEIVFILVYLLWAAQEARATGHADTGDGIDLVVFTILTLVGGFVVYRLFRRKSLLQYAHGFFVLTITTWANTWIMLRMDAEHGLTQLFLMLSWLLTIVTQIIYVVVIILRKRPNKKPE